MHPAVRAQTAVDHYRNETGSNGDDLATTLADLIADLQLWATHHRLDWESAAERAHWYAEEEHCCAEHAMEGDAVSGVGATALRTA